MSSPSPSVLGRDFQRQGLSRAEQVCTRSLPRPLSQRAWSLRKGDTRARTHMEMPCEDGRHDCQPRSPRGHQKPPLPGDRGCVPLAAPGPSARTSGSGLWGSVSAVPSPQSAGALRGQLQGAKTLVKRTGSQRDPRTCGLAHTPLDSVTPTHSQTSPACKGHDLGQVPDLPVPLFPRLEHAVSRACTEAPRRGVTEF